jgi:GTPase
VSSVSGEGLAELHALLSSLRPPPAPLEAASPLLMHVETLLPPPQPHMACLAAGAAVRGCALPSDRLWLGPLDWAGGRFVRVRCHSVHVAQAPAPALRSGQAASLALCCEGEGEGEGSGEGAATVERLLQQQRKGLVLLGGEREPRSAHGACVALLLPLTAQLAVGAQCVLHCGSVRASVRVAQLEAAERGMQAHDAERAQAAAALMGTAVGAALRATLVFVHSPQWLDDGAQLLLAGAGPEQGLIALGRVLDAAPASAPATP